MSENGDRVNGRVVPTDVGYAFRPALAGFVALVLIAALLAIFRDETDRSDPTALAVAVWILGVVAFGTMIAAGFRAGRGLGRARMESAMGRFAVRMAVVLAVVLPVMVLALGALAASDTWEGDSEPFLAVWVGLAVVASILGGLAPEPGRRAILVFPLLLGVAALVLFLSEVSGIS